MLLLLLLPITIQRSRMGAGYRPPARRSAAARRSTGLVETSSTLTAAVTLCAQMGPYTAGSPGERRFLHFRQRFVLRVLGCCCFCISDFRPSLSLLGYPLQGLSSTCRYLPAAGLVLYVKRPEIAGVPGVALSRCYPMDRSPRCPVGFSKNCGGGLVAVVKREDGTGLPRS